MPKLKLTYFDFHGGRGEPARLRGRLAPSGARPSTGPEKRSAPRAGQRLAGAVASRWRPPARSLGGRDRRGQARVSLVSVEVVVLEAGERATRNLPYGTLLWRLLLLQSFFEFIRSFL